MRQWSFASGVDKRPVSRRLAAAVLLALLAGACATPQTDALLRDRGALPTAGSVKEPRFFPQREYECGPAALAMVLATSGIDTDQDALVAEVYNPGRKGSLTPAVIAAARRAGRIAYPLGDLKGVFGEVAAGRPVMVLQNLALEWYPQWHYAAVVGYDLATDTIVLHSGTTPFLRMSLKTFERTWRRGDYWALTTLRPGEFPAAADAGEYARAVAGVERAGRTEVAQRAFAAAVARWPDDAVLRLGLGNTLYKLGRKAEAADAYRAAASLDPDRAEAHNNLAQVLGELGRFDEAETAARRAIALGGRHLETYRETLDGILAARARAPGKTS